jgi:hypothetical protein
MENPNAGELARDASPFRRKQIMNAIVESRKVR